MDLLADETLLGFFEALSDGKFAEEAFPEILKQISSNQVSDLEEALSKAGLGMIKENEW